MDVGRTVREQIGAAEFTALQQMTVQERIRHAEEGGEVYIPSTGLLGQGFALQSGQESYAFGHEAKATVAPSWRNEVTLSSLEAILEYAPARTIDMIAPRPLLMILAKDDGIAPPELARSAFARAGEPKGLLEIDGGHYSVYRRQGADEAGQAAAALFSKHLTGSK
jgi:fermentation-respiration switch protein FrsA (DUF1100 family)